MPITNTKYAFSGVQSTTSPQIIYTETQQPAKQEQVKSIYSNFWNLFDTDPNQADIQVDYNQLINKKWLQDQNNLLKIAGGPGFNEKDFRKLGEAALNYKKYYDENGEYIGNNTRKALKAKEVYDKYLARVGQFAQSLKQKRYKIDENGNPVLVYEGAEGFKDGYNTADEAKAAYAQQQQYNKDARSWAGRNYMDKKDWGALKYEQENKFTNHDTVIDHLVSLAGPNISEELIAQAKRGSTWGKASNQIFQAALDNLAKTNYREAKALYNSINGLYGKNDKNFQFFNNTSLYDGSNAFTNANKRNWLESEAGVADVTNFYQNNNDPKLNGYDDDYQDYLKEQEKYKKWQKENGGFGASYSTQFKQGGKMNKYQQGGQAPTAAQMVLQALSAAQQGDQSGLQQLFSDKKTAQAVIQQLQKEAQEGSEEAIQALEALKQIMSGSKKQATMAQKGAKLSYIHRLATGCPPGMEITYFKRGGRLCKACIEKAKKAKEGASLDNIIAKNKRRYPGITDDQAAGRAPIRKNGKDYYLDGDGVLGEASKKGKYGFGGFLEYFKSGGKNSVKRVSKEITDDGYEMKFSDGTSSNYGRNPMNGKSVAIGRDGKTYKGEKADSVLINDSQKTVPAIKANKKKSMACGGKAKKPKCGTKAKCGAELEKCGGKTPMTKCGGKAPMDKCGGKTTLAKCGTELKKCGGKAKKSSPKKPVVNKDKCGGKAKKHAIGGNLELLKYMILNYNK